MAGFDVKKARQSGYSDEEIKSYLSKYYDVNSAINAGYSLDEIGSSISFDEPSFTPPKQQAQQLRPTVAPASSTETMSTSPYAQQYAKMAREDRGDIAKNIISFGLPFLATGLTGGAAIPAAGGLAATGEALGTKVGDVIAGRRTPDADVIGSSVGAGIGGMVGEGLGRGLVAGLSKIKAPFASGYNPQMDKLAKQYGLTLPASAVTENRAVPLLESLAGKSAFGNKLTQMTLNAERKLTDVADEFIRGIDATPDASTAGIKSAEGLKRYEDTFRGTKNALYDAAKLKKGDVTVNPTETIKVLDEIIGNLRNSANPNTAELKYFTSLKAGLGEGDKLRTQLQKQGFNEATINRVMAQNKMQSGVDGTTVLNTVRNLNRKTNWNSADPISTGYQAELKKIAATLSDEFDNALSTAKPEISEALARANATYKEGISKLNSTYGKKIKRFADAGQYDKISEAVLNKNTSVDDIPRIFEVVGDEGKQALRANLADRMIGEARRNAKGVFTPSAIDKTLKQFGDSRLKAIYTPEEYQALKDVSKLTYAVGAAQRVAEGSQTTFTAKMSGILALAFSNPLLALQFLGSDAAVAKVISSRAGQQLLRGGFPVSDVTRVVVPSATRSLGQSFGR